jgi:hypothetical protein
VSFDELFDRIHARTGDSDREIARILGLLLEDFGNGRFDHVIDEWSQKNRFAPLQPGDINEGHDTARASD